jgi:hypothetical protein
MRTPVYGLMAEFESPTALAAAAHQVREKGYRRVEAYSPFAIEEVNEALGLHHNKLPLLVLGGGILGGLTGYLMQYYVAVIEFPLNIGGRPLHSWPSFIVITFELTILFAAITTVLGLFGLCGLPEPYHPVFNVSRFAFASRDRFFLCIESRDPLFDRHDTAEFLHSLSPREVTEVAH